MKNLKEIGLLEVAMEIVGGHSNGLGEGMVTTIDGELKAHSSWHRTYSKQPLLDVVALVDTGSKEARNLERNPFTEWTFSEISKNVSIHLVGTSSVLRQLDDFGGANLLNDSLLKWEARSMFHRSPLVMHTRVSSLEVEFSGDPRCEEFGRDEILDYVQERLRARDASRVGSAFERSLGFAPSGRGKCSR